MGVLVISDERKFASRWYPDVRIVIIVPA